MARVPNIYTRAATLTCHPTPSAISGHPCGTAARQHEPLHVVFRAWQYGLIRLKPAKCLISLTYLLNIITVMRLMPGFLRSVGTPGQAGKGIGEGISLLGYLLADRWQIRSAAKGQFVAIYPWVKL